MSQGTKILKGSVLQIYRDQMLLMLFFSPFLIGIIIRFLVPFADKSVNKYLQFSIKPYYILADSITLVMGAMMIGMMVGLLMLDERDDGIAIYYSVTPIGGLNYLFSRLLFPFLYSSISIIIIMSFAILSSIEYPWFFAPAIISAFNGVLVSMLLVSIASNKVEGLAVSKLLGIICCGIPLAWFSPQHLKIFGYLLPTYWITDMLIQASRNNITNYLFDFLIGTLCVFTWIYALYGIFYKRIR